MIYFHFYWVILQEREKYTDVLVNYLLVIVEELNKEGSEFLMSEIKTLFQSVTVSQDVQNILSDVFGSSGATSKAANVQKLRQARVLKIFAPLIAKHTPGRTKQKPKALDDFVVIPPPQQVRKRHFSLSKVIFF